MTQPPDPQAAFAAAERAYLEGRLAEARAALAPLMRVSHPAVHHLCAVVEHGLGDHVAARRQFEAAARLAPGDPDICSNFGRFLAQIGEDAAALDAYERALRLAPDFGDAAFNRALLLRRLGRLDEAGDAFRALTKTSPRDPRYWNGLAATERESGDLSAAAAAYDQALAAAPADKLASVGRARVALEREEDDALERYRAARRQAPGDPELALDEAEARLGRGDRSALDDLTALVRSLPNWTHGQIALARMRWEQGERNDFADHVEALLAREPARAPLWRDYIQLLADCGEPARAAEAARRARGALADDPPLRLVEAVHAGKAGQLKRAERLFATLGPDTPGRHLNEAVHRIRRGELDRAVRLVEAALAEDGGDFAAWGVAETLYRKIGDERGAWLSAQPGLIGISQLALEPAAFRALDTLLLTLHRDTVEAVGQSVSGGTQTRWRLFDRAEPELAGLRGAIEQALAEHVAGLPARDHRHPLLRHRDRKMTIGPSWSVRFLGAGHHVPHYHPKGVISSACYFRVPPSGGAGQAGWLEIGRPPADFLMELEPIQTIEPRPGRLVLFPSYLFHGTRPFFAGERMSVAFDVGASGDA